MPGGTNTGMSRVFALRVRTKRMPARDKTVPFCFRKIENFLTVMACAKKHKACCKKYKALILKYVPCISKYMPYIFREKRHLIISDL